MNEYPSNVVVTGAAVGIGRAAADWLAKCGVKVALIDRDHDALDATCAELRGAGHQVLGVVADVSESSSVERALAEITAEWGPVESVVNNAGVVGPQAELAALDQTSFDQIYATNVRGTWLMMKHTIPAMLEAGGGSIVNLSSALGLRGGPLQAAYSASKHAVIGLTRTAAIEYAAGGIRVNAVCPGVIRTPALQHRIDGDDPAVGPLREAHPMGRFGAPDEVAACIAWLVSSHSSFVTGAQISCDGGFGA